MRNHSFLRLISGITAILVASVLRAEEPVAIKSPRIVWAYKAAEHFVAAPVAGKGALYVSGLGPFNSGVFQSLALDPQAGRREMWSFTAPDLKLPVVSAPAVVND